MNNMQSDPSSLLLAAAQMGQEDPKKQAIQQLLMQMIGGQQPSVLNSPAALKALGIGNVAKDVNYQDPNVVAAGYNNLSSTNNPNPYFSALAQQMKQAQLDKNMGLAFGALMQQVQQQNSLSPDQKAMQMLMVGGSDPQVKAQALTQLTGQTQLPSNAPPSIADAFDPAKIKDIQFQDMARRLQLEAIKAQTDLINRTNPNASQPGSPLTQANVTQVKLPDGSVRTVTYDQAVASGLPIVQQPSKLDSADKQEYFKKQDDAQKAEKLIKVVDNLENLGKTYFTGSVAGSGLPGGSLVQKGLSGVGQLFSKDSREIISASNAIDSFGKFLYEDAKKIYQGNLSEKELEFMDSMVPRTSDTPESYNLKTEYYRGLLSNNTEYGKFITKYIMQNGTMVGAQDAFKAQQGLKNSGMTIDDMKALYKSETGQDITDDQANYLLKQNGY